MVVATISPITSIVENIGGGRIVLEGIVPEGRQLAHVLTLAVGGERAWRRRT